MADPRDQHAPGAPRPRGRLKIFLGAAPGVGKTYEMLLTAHARKADGADVVIGVVETHGRRETAMLVDGLEAIPLKPVPYGDRVLQEMDLDAVLARHPALVLVDELAHTNAPGSRHPKRHMDVEELLSAGIDVLTTLNIQHVESLNDVVARITRITVRETVPDAVLDAADDIEIVDLAPDDLIRRLSEGKVYVPEQARRALDRFFTRGNLTALRELALRRAAERVDDDLLDHMRSHAIKGPWPAGERLLVCVTSDEASLGLVRHAKRAADRQRIPWIALHVETPHAMAQPEDRRDKVSEALRLAERLGGETASVPGDGIVDDILAFARERNVTQIVIGKSRRSRWFELINGSIAHDLVRGAGSIGVSVVAGDNQLRSDEPEKAVGPQHAERSFPWLGYALAAASVAVATAVGLSVQGLVGLETIDLIFLVAVLVSAVSFGLWPSLAASLAASLAYNFFFIPPVHTFTIADPTNVAAFLVFLIVAIVVSQLAAGVRAQVIAARARARTTEALYAFSRKIAAATSLDDLLWAVAFQVASMLKLEVVLLLPQDGALAVRAAYPPDDDLAAADLGAAKWAFDRGRAAGRDADTLPGARWLFVPLQTANAVVGVAGLTRAKSGAMMTPGGRRLLEALLDQAAVAIERLSLAGEMQSARVEAETERLRSSLLASLSHDLKTPLASIMGAATSLRSYGGSLTEAERADLLQTVEMEALRMTRFVSNLLDLSRLESGAIEIDRAPVDLADQVSAAAARSAKAFDRQRVVVSLPPDLPFVRADALLLDQVLVNLLENAASHAPGGTVEIRGSVTDGAATIAVADEGPGVPPADLQRIFDKYYRAGERDRRPAGAGLGLAICRGFMTAMGGTITAENRTDRSGAIFTLRFPPALVVGQPRTEAA